MTEEELPDGFPIEKAKDWIDRWKKAGGGFFCHPQEGGAVMVQLAFKSPPVEIATEGGEPAPSAIEKAEHIQAELLGDPELKSAVTTLVANAWHKSRALTGEVKGNA